VKELRERASGGRKPIPRPRDEGLVAAFRSLSALESSASTATSFAASRLTNLRPGEQRVYLRVSK